MFPLVAEIYQNVPTIVVVQTLPDDNVPLVIHIQSSGDPVFFVYLANAVERIAMVERWLQNRVTFLAPYVLTFDGVVVTGAQDVRVVAGSVLHVRVRTRRELADPGSSTEGSGPSLDLQTHETWSSMSFSQEDVNDLRISGVDGSLHESQLQPSSLHDFANRSDDEGDGVHFMQRIEVIDADGRIYDQIVPQLHRDWLHDIEVFLPRLRDVRSFEEDTVVQIVAGRGTKLRDLLVRVPVEALSSPEKFRELMSSVLPSDLRFDCRCFMARVRLVNHAPLILAVHPLARRQVPQLIWYRGVTRPDVRKIVLVEAEHTVVDYYYSTTHAVWDTNVFRAGAHHFQADERLVHHSYVVPWVPATVIQIDQLNSCEDDMFDVILPVPEVAISLMQASSRRIVGNPSDPLVPYVLTAFRMRSLRAFSWLHTWDKRDGWAMVFQSHVLDVARPIKDQLLVAWATHQVRPDVTVYPVQPRSQALHGFHPVFLLLPADREDYVGMLVTVWTPHMSFQGSYLLRSFRFPTGQRLFDILIRGHQCVWVNACQVRIGDQVFEWGTVVPIHAGVNIELHSDCDRPRKHLH